MNRWVRILWFCQNTLKQILHDFNFTKAGNSRLLFREGFVSGYPDLVRPIPLFRVMIDHRCRLNMLLDR